jgi:hypothetical protein
MVGTILNHERTFYNCACGGEVLVVDYYKEDEEFNLAVFKYKSAASIKMNFWQRIRWSFYILKNGYIWSDEIQLYKDEAKKLGIYLYNKNNNYSIKENKGE